MRAERSTKQPPPCSLGSKGLDTIKAWGLKLANTKCHAKARVAVARKLAIVMHAMWRDGTFYVGDPDAS